MNVKDNLPQSDVNKEYFLQNVDNQVYEYITYSTEVSLGEEHFEPCMFV